MEEYLKEVGERCNKATAGPWTTGHSIASTNVGYKGILDFVKVGRHQWIVGHQELKAETESRYLPNGLVETKLVGKFEEPKPNFNAEFIAHARDDIPKLLNFIKELSGEVQEWQASFNLFDKAQGRAIELWRAQDPKNREFILPDMADLTLWLLNQLK
jgi:hypothetical protein